MKLGKKQLEEAIFGRIGFQRFTQDSPVLPDVWLAFGDEPTMERDLSRPRRGGHRQVSSPTRWPPGCKLKRKSQLEKLSAARKTTRSGYRLQRFHRCCWALF